MSESIDIKADLKIMEEELVKLQDELAKMETSRNQTLQKLHQLSGAAAYLRGKLPPEEQPVIEQPEDILKINDNDSEDLKLSKMTDNAKKREMYQINKTSKGFKDADLEDIIIVSDLDEIPNLENINFKKINKKIIFFKQKMYYYKLNLLYKSFVWHGSKACKKKYLISPEILRSSKNKKYPLWRIDTYFSKLKNRSVHVVDNGGWHFSNIKKPEELEKKMLNFLHYVDYKNSGFKLSDLKQLMKEKRVMYNHSVDKKGNKWGQGKKLDISKINEMPKYIFNNMEKYKSWLEPEEK